MDLRMRAPYCLSLRLDIVREESSRNYFLDLQRLNPYRTVSGSHGCWEGLGSWVESSSVATANGFVDECLLRWLPPTVL